MKPLRHPRHPAKCAPGCIACSVLVCACSLSPSPQAPAPGAHQRADTPAAQRLAQVDFGEAAHFVLCIEPACPTVSPKTLAVLPRGNPVMTAAPDPISAASHATAAAHAPDPIPVPDTTPRQLVLQFGTDSAALTTEHRAQLRDLVRTLPASSRLVIAGRTDDQGSAAHNDVLARARAQAARDHLHSLDPGLTERLAIEARGRCCYAAPNTSADGRARNRRVELIRLPPAEVQR